MKQTNKESTLGRMPNAQLAVWRKRGCSAAENAVGI